MRGKLGALLFFSGYGSLLLGGCGSGKHTPAQPQDALSTDIWFPTGFTGRDGVSSSAPALNPGTGKTGGGLVPGATGAGGGAGTGTTGGGGAGAGTTTGGGAGLDTETSTGPVTSGDDETTSSGGGGASSSGQDPSDPQVELSIAAFFPDTSNYPEPHPDAGLMPHLGENPKIFDPEDRSAPDHPSYQPPGSDPAVMIAKDWGYFTTAFARKDGSVFRSAKYESGRGAHQRLLVGVETFTPLFSWGEGPNTYNGYTVFDASKVTNAQGAAFEVFIRQQTAKMNNHWFMTSEDKTERLGIFPVERTSPKLIMTTPPQMTNDHAVDPWICLDLGDGIPYGVVDLSREMLSSSAEVHPSPFAAKPDFRDCSTPEGSCGRWLSIPLSEGAVQDINAGKGLMAVGLSLVTNDYGSLAWNEIKAKRPDLAESQSIKEWTLITANGDDPTYVGSPDFTMPAPRIRLSY